MSLPFKFPELKAFVISHALLHLPSHPSLFHRSNNVSRKVKILRFLIMLHSPARWYFPSFRPQYSLQHHVVTWPNTRQLASCWTTIPLRLFYCHTSYVRDHFFAAREARPDSRNPNSSTLWRGSSARESTSLSDAFDTVFTHREVTKSTVYLYKN
jgi:hypothetical protein